MSDFSDLEDMMRAVSSCFHHRTYQELYKKKTEKDGYLQDRSRRGEADANPV
jgi:hypothetical protein